MHSILQAAGNAHASASDLIARYPIAPEVLILIAIYFLVIIGWFAHQFSIQLSQEEREAGKKGHKSGLELLGEFAAFLVAGTLVAQCWAHLDYASYQHYLHKVLFHIDIGPLVINFTLHFLVNDGFMTFFFMVATIELCQEVLLKKGSLYMDKAILPIGGTVGGVVGPALVFQWIAIEQPDAWIVPTATDIAFAWMGARMLFGPKHPITIFLLALAIVDDLIGMGLIAIKLSHGNPHWFGLVLSVASLLQAIAMRLLSRRFKILHAWQPYLMICAPQSWLGLYLLGFHPALCMVFIVPWVPMKAWGTTEPSHDDGAFVHQYEAHDPMNNLKHAFEPLVNTGLFLFGLANAGVLWLGLEGAWTRDSSAVFFGLGIGKVVGITSFTLVTYAIFKGVYHLLGKEFTWPVNEKGQAMTAWDLPKIGILASIGFTVALFVVDAGGWGNDLRLGALASIGYLAVAVVYEQLDRFRWAYFLDTRNLFNIRPPAALGI